MAIPLKDSELVTYSQNMNDRLVASGVTTYQLAAPIVAGYTPKHDAFELAYNNLQTARDAGTRSESLTQTKDLAKAELLAYARPIYLAVQHNPNILDADKTLLGVKVIDREPTPVPVPTRKPVLSVLSVEGRTVFLSVQGATNERKRPLGAIGAQVLSFVGENPPADFDAWNAEALVGKPNVSIAFPPDLVPGTKVWLTACWFNTRKETGPLAIPVFAYLSQGVSEAA